MLLQQHSNNTQLILTTCHSANSEETMVVSVRNRELAQPRVGHTSEDNNQQHHSKHNYSIPAQLHNCGLPNAAMHLRTW